MLYLGGKGRCGKAITEVILSTTPRRETLVEPFLGGGSVARHLAPHFASVLAGDTHEDLMLMWQAAAAGWVGPRSVTETEYAAARNMAPCALRAFIGFGCSYGGKWWGGYARPRGDRPCRTHPDYYARLASEDVASLGAILSRARLERTTYETWERDIDERCVVYADPPYANTTGYKSDREFDHAAFWITMQRWHDRGAHVFVSEYHAPDGWCSIWTKDQRRKVSGGTGDMTREHLFARV